METFATTIKLTSKDYLICYIKDERYDDTELRDLEMEVTISVTHANTGFIFEVYQINNIKGNYTGINFTEGENIDKDETFTIDGESWNLNINKTKSNDENFGLFISDVQIDIVAKKIDVNFEF